MKQEFIILKPTILPTVTWCLLLSLSIKCSRATDTQIKAIKRPGKHSLHFRSVTRLNRNH